MEKPGILDVSPDAPDDDWEEDVDECKRID